MAKIETSPTPESFLKRSPLCRALGDRGARFTEIDGAAVADGFGDELLENRHFFPVYQPAGPDDLRNLLHFLLAQKRFCNRNIHGSTPHYILMKKTGQLRHVS